MKVIDKNAVLNYPLQSGKCDAKNSNKHFVYGVDSVMEYVKNLPYINLPLWKDVKEELPEEHNSIFAPLYGTTEWLKAVMFEKISKEVIVVVKKKDNTFAVTVGHTVDSKWRTNLDRCYHQPEVVYWMEPNDLLNIPIEKLGGRIE